MAPGTRTRTSKSMSHWRGPGSAKTQPSPVSGRTAQPEPVVHSLGKPPAATSTGQGLRTQRSMPRWVEKQNVVYPYSGALLSHRGSEALTRCYVVGNTCLGRGDRGVLACGMYSTCQIHRDRERTSGCQWVGKGQMGSGC